MLDIILAAAASMGIVKVTFANGDVVDITDVANAKAALAARFAKSEDFAAILEAANHLP